MPVCAETHNACWCLKISKNIVPFRWIISKKDCVISVVGVGEMEVANINSKTTRTVSYEPINCTAQKRRSKYTTLRPDYHVPHGTLYAVRGTNCFIDTVVATNTAIYSNEWRYQHVLHFVSWRSVNNEWAGYPKDSWSSAGGGAENKTSLQGVENARLENAGTLYDIDVCFMVICVCVLWALSPEISGENRLFKTISIFALQFQID